MHGFCLVRDTEICEVCYGLPSGESSVVNDSTTNGSSPKDLSAAIDSTTMDESDRNLRDASANSNITQKDSTAIDSTTMYESDRNLGDALANSNITLLVDSAKERLVLSKDRSDLTFVTDLWKQNFNTFKAELYDPETLNQESFPDDTEFLNGYLPMNRFINGTDSDLYPCLLKNKE